MLEFHQTPQTATKSQRALVAMWGKRHSPFCSWEIPALRNVWSIPAALPQVRAWMLPHSATCTSPHQHWQDSQRCLCRQKFNRMLDRHKFLYVWLDNLFWFSLVDCECTLKGTLKYLWWPWTCGVNVVIYLVQRRRSGSVFCSTFSAWTGFCDLCVCSTLRSLENKTESKHQLMNGTHYFTHFFYDWFKTW